MTKFIRLTECAANGAIKPILINAAYILHVQIGIRSADTHIRMKDDGFYFVKESFEEISKMLLEAPQPLQPIMVTKDSPAYAYCSERGKLAEGNKLDVSAL